MKILHYFLGLYPFHLGGLMIYARDLAKQQQKDGNKVIMLMPGKYKENKRKSTIRFYQKKDGLSIYQITNGLPYLNTGIANPNQFFAMVGKNNYENFLRRKKVDLVHIHSLIGLPKELLVITKKLKIKTCFTSHDFFGICPKINLVNFESKNCTDYNLGLDCIKCNLNLDNNLAIRLRNKNLARIYQLLIIIYNNPIIKKVYRHIKTLIINENSRQNTIIKTRHKSKLIKNKITANEYVKLRNYYLSIFDEIDIFLFNSLVTMKVYSNYINLDNKTYHILPVTHSFIKDNRMKKGYKEKEDGKVHFAFMGYLVREKGFEDLIESLNIIKTSQVNWKISIYGDYTGIDIKKFNNQFFQFKGQYTHNDFSKIFSTMDILILPSKCKETFAFTGLEAISYGIPVIASSNVGFSDLIDNNITGLIYKDDDKNLGLIRCIRSVLNNLDIISTFKKNLLSKNFTYNIEQHASEIQKNIKNFMKAK